MTTTGLTLLVTVVPALVMLGWAAALVRRARRSVDWPVVAGTITKSWVVKGGKSNSPRVAYDYVIAGERHAGRRIWVGPTSVSVSGDWPDGVVARYPVGATVRVAVDPADPSYAALEPGARALHWLPLAGAVLFLAGGLIAALAVP